ncbi:MAG: zinc-binding dehydrogenase [Microthrixaceae bacterium]
MRCTALSAGIASEDTTAVIGAGTMGLAVVAAIARHCPPRQLVVAARHPHQQDLARSLAGSLPTTVATDAQLIRAVRGVTGTMVIGSGAQQRCTGGVDVTIDCVGTSSSLALALAVTRPGGRVVMVGMPGVTTVDLTPLWQREIALSGAYTYGTERLDGDRVPHLRPRDGAGGGSRSRGPGECHLPVVAFHRCHRARSGRRPPRRHQDLLRSAGDQMSRDRQYRPRPGLVLDVDRSTPPVLMHHGEQLRLQKLPADRSRIIYPPEPLEPIEDPAGRARHSPHLSAAIR